MGVIDDLIVALLVENDLLLLHSLMCASLLKYLTSVEVIFHNGCPCNFATCMYIFFLMLCFSCMM